MKGEIVERQKEWANVSAVYSNNFDFLDFKFYLKIVHFYNVTILNFFPFSDAQKRTPPN